MSVGVFLKRAQTFAQLRPKDRWVALSFSLRRPVRHECIVRKVVSYHGRYHHVANLRRPVDLDDRLRAWLTEAYLDSRPEHPGAFSRPPARAAARTAGSGPARAG